MCGQSYSQLCRLSTVFATGKANAGDVVIIAGKGHEKSICFGTIEFPWSDQETVLKSLGRVVR